MELKDFTEKEQEMIKNGLTTSKISDKETAEKILALVPQDLIKRIPFFVRKHATTRTIKRISIEMRLIVRVVACFLTKNGIRLIKSCGTSARIFSAVSLSLILDVVSPFLIISCSFSVKSFNSIRLVLLFSLG